MDLGFTCTLPLAIMETAEQTPSASQHGLQIKKDVIKSLVTAPVVPPL